MNNLLQNKTYIYILIGGAVIFLVVLSIVFLRLSNSETKTIDNADSKTSSLLVLSPTISSDPMTALKNRLSQPVLYEGVTVEYRKGSDTWIVFYNGTKQQTEAILIKFFNANRVSDFSSEKFEYISLSVTLDPPQGYYQR